MSKLKMPFFLRYLEPNWGFETYIYEKAHGIGMSKQLKRKIVNTLNNVRGKHGFI